MSRSRQVTHPRCAADLKFIAARAMEDLPVDDLELIARIKDDSEHRTAA